MGKRSVVSLFAVLFLLFAQRDPARAQVAFPTVGPTINRVASSRDFATEVLGDPWDMTTLSDVSSYAPALDNPGLALSVFGEGTIRARMNAPEGLLYFLSPGQCEKVALASSGTQLPIDSQVYRSLTFRVNVDVRTDVAVRVHRSCGYKGNYWTTVPLSLSPGWGTYTIDLRTVPHQSAVGDDAAWESQPATGLALVFSGATQTAIQLDWMMLTDGASNSIPIPLTFNGGGSQRFSIVADTDTYTNNGYSQVVGLGLNSASSAVFASTRLGPDTYYVAARESADFASLLGDPWDFQTADDLQSTSGFVNQYVSGRFQGTVNVDTASLSLDLKGQAIPTDMFRYLRISGTYAVSQAATATLRWYGADRKVSGSCAVTVTSSTTAIDIDLGNLGTSCITTTGAWSGQVYGLSFAPSNRPGSVVTLTSVSLRADGFGPIDEDTTVTYSPWTVTVNSPPLFQFDQPDRAGGADFATEVLGNPWNMDDRSDIYAFYNLSSAQIQTAATVAGGDPLNVFAGSGVFQNTDPYLFVLGTLDQAKMIDTNRYKHLTYRLLVTGDTGASEGISSRFGWQVADRPSGDSFLSDDVGYSPSLWQTFTFDLDDAPVDPAINPPGSYVGKPWSGRVRALRFDPTELTSVSTFYYDYIRVTADDEANSRFALAYRVSDRDQDPVTINFFYRSTPGTTGGTAIGATAASAGSAYLWDTATLQNGRYYLYATVDDGYNRVTRPASGPLLVDHGRSQDTTPPILTITSPTVGQPLYDTIDVLGSALDNVQLANLSLLVDGKVIATIRPRLLSPTPQAAYPQYTESGNSGFLETISLASVAVGSHELRFIATDTAGNQTSQQFDFQRVAGANPSAVSLPNYFGAILDLTPPANPFPTLTPTATPYVSPTPTLTPTITPTATPVPKPLQLVIAPSAKESGLRFSVSAVKGKKVACKQIGLRGGGSPLQESAKAGVQIKSITKVPWSAKAVRLPRFLKGTTAPRLGFLVTCNGAVASEVVETSTETFKNNKKVSSSKDFLRSLADGLK